ncbi:hypothetical protein [Sinorhizobium fredii]|uniref:Uncharacterized protein n=1 Tax=Rhizobium fredii TaxID=380 RepID=A0A2L0HCF0_RHIFR|nr:hypothetical protein [Sinorhizobium fredii]AUX78449.1 hypothetical protein NXT3_PA00157 [Sinorhizobium fredii]
MNRMPSSVHKMDVRLPASGPPRRSVDLDQAVIKENAKPAPREFGFLAPGDQRHVLLSLLNRVAAIAGNSENVVILCASWVVTKFSLGG